MQLIRARRMLGALRRDRAGVAMIEFAMCLPVLLLLVLYGLESANLVLAHMRISRIASMTADNASRVRDSIDESDINELMTGADIASGSYNLQAQGRVIISDLQKNDGNTGQWIRWQRCYGSLTGGSVYGAAGKGKNDASLQAMGPPGRQIAAADVTSVMFVEVRYAYMPLIGGPWGSPQTIAYTSSYNVRKRANGDVNNAGNLPPAKIASC